MIKKNLFFILFASLCNASQQPIILWDLHGVLLKQDSQIKTVLSSPYLKEAVLEVSWPLVKEIAGLIHYHLFHDPCSQEYIRVARKHNNQALEKLMLEVANAQRPIAGMPELLSELALLGHEQHIGSNIGKSSFEQLTNPELYPELSIIFNPLEIPKSYIAHVKENVCIKKPSYRFFQNYLLKNNIDLNTQDVIFIDDNKKNIQAAQAFGFDAIYFKHPNQLRQELAKRGIPVGKPAYGVSDQTTSHALYNRSLFYH